MSFVVTAVVGTVVQTGASIYGAKKAGKALKRATDQTVAEQQRQYDQTREDFSPWRESGGEALGRLDRAMSGDQSDFTTSAGYNFVRDEGMRDTENRFSVGGGGGNAMKALTEFNSGLASTEYGNWFNRNLNMSGQGMGAAQSTARAGANSANQIGGAYMNQGIGQANIETNQASNINNALQGGISNYLYGQRTNAYDKRWQDKNPVGTPPFNPAEERVDIDWEALKG